MKVKLLLFLSILLFSNNIVYAATDDFNRADANPIGGNWVTVTSESGMRIISNEVRGISVSGRNGAYYTGTFNNNQYSQIRLTPNGSLDIGPTVRVSSSTETFYNAVATNGTPGTIRIRKFVSGTITNLQDFSANIANNDILKLAVVGTTLEAFVNGVSVGTTTDSSISSGNPGIFTFASAAFGDDWEGGDITASQIIRHRVLIQ